MLNVKKLLTKILDGEYIIKDYNVTTTNNSSVTPFGAYASFAFPDAPSGYRVVSSELLGLGSTNPAIARAYSDEGCFVYSKSAATYTLRVMFGKLGGGYFITSFMSTFSRLAERWWEYVEYQENPHQSACKYEIAYKGRSVWMGFKSFGYGWESAYTKCKSVKFTKSFGQAIRVHVQGLADVYNEWVGWLCLPIFANNRNHRYLDNFCEGVDNRREHLRGGYVYQKRLGIASTSERGWTCA